METNDKFKGSEEFKYQFTCRKVVIFIEQNNSLQSYDGCILNVLSKIKYLSLLIIANLPVAC